MKINTNSKNELKIPFYERLCNIHKGQRNPIKTAVVNPVTVNTLEGAIAARKEKFIDPVFIGSKTHIYATAKKHKINIDGCEIIEVENTHMAAETAANLARDKYVNAIMKGHIHTNELITPITKRENYLRTQRRMSHIFVIDVPLQHYPKPLFLSDAAINIRPNLMEKKDIIQNAIDLFHACGFGKPKVAILSATERINIDIPSTIEAAALCKMAERGSIKGGILDGPLAFDNAISKSAAKIKNLKSDVAGNADILITPDIETGNMLYKQMRYLAGYNAAGIVIGAKIPIILTSRAGGKMARLASSALAFLYANQK